MEEQMNRIGAMLMWLLATMPAGGAVLAIIAATEVHGMIGWALVVYPIGLAVAGFFAYLAYLTFRLGWATWRDEL